jgi:hypothetical protein
MARLAAERAEVTGSEKQVPVTRTAFELALCW